MYNLVMNTFFFVSKNKTFPFDYIKFLQKHKMYVILFCGAGHLEQILMKYQSKHKYYIE